MKAEAIMNSLPNTMNPEAFTGRLTEVALGYQRMLKQNPHNAEALVGMSLVALASSQTDAAVQMATAGVEAAPDLCVAWVTLGQTLRAANRNADAECAYSHALELDGMNPLARVGLGELKLLTQRAHDAEQDFEFALQRQPAMAAARLGLGNAFAFQCRDQEALSQYELALAQHPRLPEADFAVGFVLARLGRVKEAEAHYRRALVLRPDFAAAWMNLGQLLQEQGRELYAEAALQRAVELRPDMIAGWINLSVLERERFRITEAEAYLRKAFALDPNQMETHVAWCQLCVARQDRAGAWEWLRWALARDPSHSEAVNMHGILLHNDGRFAEAELEFERAEALGSRPAASNRGNSLLEMGRMTEALQVQTRAAEFAPQSAGAQYNLSLTQLRLGQWEQGWPAYEARWRFREVHRRPRKFDQPRWQGEHLEGRRILLHAEQGLGDSIQFCRYATLVAARGGFPILQVQTPVERLLRSLAVVRSGLGETAILESQPGVPQFDLECPLMSLPAVFGVTLQTVPWTGAYLGADPAEARQTRLRLPGECSALRVGLAWAGNPGYKADNIRSTNLKTLAPLLLTHDITWISLQKGAPATQLDALPAGANVWDGSSQERDLAETAALIANLDLVITTDTSIAHLAGAMGKPVWIMLPHLADWRWMERTETTPWYPTARLFRQQSPGDWPGLVERVTHELHHLLQPQLRFPAGQAGPFPMKLSA